MNGLDELCRSFLKELDNDKLLTLAIPKGTVGNEQDDDAAAGNMDLLPNNAATISRRFTSALTRRKYVQLFAVAALVAELQSSKPPDACCCLLMMLCAARQSLDAAEGHLLRAEASLQEPARMQCHRVGFRQNAAFAAP